MSNGLPSYDLQHLRVLVVERNRHMRSLVCQILRSFGIRLIRDVADGAEALKELKHFRPDIITTGFMMDPINGVEFVKTLRRADDSPCPMVPIIMITAFSEDSRVREARDAGVNEFLTKPFSARDVYLRIVECIDHQRPFVRAKSYVGPCRHRHEDEEYQGPRRRTVDGVTGRLLIDNDDDDDDGSNGGRAAA